MTRKTAAFWIEHLNLQPHPEGGYYAETYRARSGEGERAASTGIYFLLGRADVSRFHRIDADEMWHFYGGDPLNVHMIDASGAHSYFTLGANPGAGEVLQAVVPADVWFGARLASGGDYALVGCTVAPGFMFEHFELAERGRLIAEFPQHASIIRQLTA